MKNMDIERLEIKFTYGNLLLKGEEEQVEVIGYYANSHVHDIFEFDMEA